MSTALVHQLTHADVEKIMRLVEILHRSRLQFLRIEADGMDITIAKDCATKADEVTIRSPSVGVFRSDAVRVGSLVEPTTALGSVQTLDETTTVSASVAGRIIEGCVRDGDFVEFGQPLYRIHPTKDERSE